VFRVFISYSRNDNIAPPDNDGLGFVSLFCQRLKTRFTELGPPRLELFFDTHEIKKNERFTGRITDGLRAADALIVVMSPNWLASDYCRQELETFVRQRREHGEAAIARQIFIVGRRHLDWDKRPQILRETEGYLFYDLEPGRGAGSEEEFYRFGRVDPRFGERLHELTRDLWQVAQTEQTVRAQSEPAGRTVYLAKAAADFRYAYNRMYDELENRGFAVVPPRELDLAREPNAAQLVADALHDAEISVHVLGQSAGPPIDGGAALVPLQLQSARAEAEQRGARPFARLIWAPRFVVDEDAVQLLDAERDPVAVVRAFEQLASEQGLAGCDTVEGSELGTFRDVVLRHLELNAPRVERTFEQTAGDKVFLLHLEEDTAFAISVGKALEGRQLTVVPPEMDGPPSEVDAANAALLRECDVVVACWGNVFETRVMAQLRKLMGPDFASDKNYKFKGLVMGPEPKAAKQKLLAFPPRPIVDRTLDLTTSPVTPEALDPLFQSPPA
jgi:hypothetical protein